MDKIPKVVSVDTNLGETYRQAAYKRMERAKARESKESFGDIYDVRLLSAELNRSSADFKGMIISEAGKELSRVISKLDEVNTSDEILNAFPSEEIIELSKLASRNNKNRG